VVVDVLEAERVEPARGSWADVSESVPAVDDDRLGMVQRGGAVGVKPLERKVDRAGKVLLGELRLGEHLDELRAGVE
jgi:hypothetical protein